jgi:WhiB family transcriptional regulator, redox-sensing transcriptional regulator
VDVFTDTVFVAGTGTIGDAVTGPFGDTGGVAEHEHRGPHEGLRLIDTLVERGTLLDGQDDGELEDWQERALCAQTDPEAFFPEKGGSTREAKRICAGCEVRAECLEYALAQDERFGIWGGLSERERRRLRRAAV